MPITEILALFAVPGTVTGLIVWLFKRSLDKREAAREKKEENREKLQLLILQSVQAETALSRATAKAVQRIPEFQCNGDMTKALEYEETVKRKRRAFLDELGIHALHED